VKGGAIQVTLVSNAIPLPHQEQNENVLTPDTPSKAPAPPAPKAKEAVDETAIPITGKEAKPQKEETRKTQLHQPPPKPDNRAQFGEQSGSALPRATIAHAECIEWTSECRERRLRQPLWLVRGSHQTQGGAKLE
jgi:hypothetical protein